MRETTWAKVLPDLKSICIFFLIVRYKLLQSLFAIGYLSLVQRNASPFQNGFVKEMHVKGIDNPEGTQNNEQEGLIWRLLSVYQNSYFVYLKSQTLF
jgi:hypothetical protein